MSATAESVATLLAELVAIPSVSGDEAAAADHAGAFLAAHGVATERLGNTLLARVGPRSEPGGAPRLLLNSHLDTVPVGAGWTVDPYAARWTEGRLYGRGANDAKASASAMAWAVARLAREASLPGEVWLALTACEETTNAGMTAVVERLGPPDAAVTGEPTGLRVVRAQSGLAVLEATWTGRSCHAAHVARVEHESALVAAARAAASGPGWWTIGREHDLLGASTLALTVLRAGERHNVVPDHAEALLDARLAPPLTAADAAAFASTQLAGAEVRVRSARLGAVETAADHPVVLAALQAAGQATAIGSSTLSDMALLPGVPAVKCGPGETARSHTPDEYVTLAELEAGAAFYEDVARRILSALAEQGTPRREHPTGWRRA